jgi:dihydrolipoamide dehydrogenase
MVKCTQLQPLEDKGQPGIAKLSRNAALKFSPATSEAVENPKRRDRQSQRDAGKIHRSRTSLVAIGFRPNSAGLGLEEAGVKLDGKGFIQVDEKLATSVPGIWAIGDVTGKLLLAHLASAQGILCADALAGRQVNPINYQNVPHATYCQPQVASFGLSEAQARLRQRDQVCRFPFQATAKPWA